MSRWRDIKRNRIKKDVAKELPSDYISSSSLYKRLKAFLTDSFLITTPILYIVIYLIMGGGDSFAQNRIEGWSLIIALTFVIFVFFFYVKCQTPGMKAYELKIVNSSKKRINFFQSIVRYFAILIACISILLLFIPFFNKNKRTFQDIISNTFIIDEQ